MKMTDAPLLLRVVCSSGHRSSDEQPFWKLSKDEPVYLLAEDFSPVNGSLLCFRTPRYEALLIHMTALPTFPHIEMIKIANHLATSPTANSILTKNE